MDADRFTNPIIDRIAVFLRGIGIGVRAGTIEKSFLPGFQIECGEMIVDESKVTHPGDLLHEAGHLAVVVPDRRARMYHGVGRRGAEEMSAIAWSYAAALHIGIDPHIVLHDAGYRGSGATLVENYRNGGIYGQPMLDIFGMTHAGQRPPPEGAPMFPHMLRWLRE
jgi:hypothetical protein